MSYVRVYIQRCYMDIPTLQSAIDYVERMKDKVSHQHVIKQYNLDTRRWERVN